LQTQFSPPASAARDHHASAAPGTSANSRLIGLSNYTSAVILACELDRRGAAVTIIDADPNRPVSAWARRPGRPEGLEVVADTEETVIDAIEAAAARVPFVIVDLDGTASLTVAYQPVDKVGRPDIRHIM
jgi:hypothetical protein